MDVERLQNEAEKKVLEQQKFARRLAQSFASRIDIHRNIVIRLILEPEAKANSGEE